MGKKIKDTMQTMFYCLLLSWRASAFYTVYRLLYKIATPLVGMLSIYIGKLFMDCLVTINSDDKALRRLLIIFIIQTGISIGTDILRRIDEFVSGLHESILQRTISETMMEKSMNVDLEFFDNPEYYDKLVAVERDMHAVTYVIWSAVGFISACISCIGSFVILAKVNLWVAISLIICMIPVTIQNRKYTKIRYNLSLEQVNENRKLGYLYSLLTGKNYAQDIRLYDIGEKIKAQYIKLWYKLFYEIKKLSKKQSFINAILSLLPLGVQIFFTVYIILRISKGQATIGDYSLYIGMIYEFRGGIDGLANSFVTIFEQKLRIDNVKTMNEMQCKVYNNGTLELKEFETLEFDHVYFTYPSLTEDILSDVSFKIKKGQHVAMVGLNGAGKSTIIKLVLRYYDIERGTIKINGHDIKEYEIHSLRKIFSTAFQQATIYGFTLRENIAIGEEEISDEQTGHIYDAIGNADAWSFYWKMTKGLETSLTRFLDQEGVELSGGQYQKVTLARAFYRQSQFLLLDEPSAALDPEAEYQVFQRLQLLAKGKTALFTSHRLSNVTMADWVIVIEEGKIIEQGSLKELLARKERFYTLFNYQAKQFSTQLEEVEEKSEDNIEEKYGDNIEETEPKVVQ